MVNARQNPNAKIDGIIHKTWFVHVDVDVYWWTKKECFIMQLNLIHAYGRRQALIITTLHIQWAFSNIQHIFDKGTDKS